MTARKGQRWADVRPCGTEAAYRRHLRRGEKPCESCRQANVRASQDRYSTEGRRARYYARERVPGLSPCTACITLGTAVLCHPLLVQEGSGQAVAWYQCRECGHSWSTSWNLSALGALGTGDAA